MQPEFSHVRQYIRELGELGSSTEFLVRYGAFTFTGLLYLCFAVTLTQIFQGARYCALAAGLIALDGLGRIGAGVFACNPGCSGPSPNQELHHLFATVGFSSGILAAIAWGYVLRQRGWARSWLWYSVASGILALMLLLLMSSSRIPLDTAGLFEHLATGVLSLWLLVFAVRLLGQEQPAPRPP